jgi:GTP-binding protein
MATNHEAIRNIAIIAHVDHGKTAITDALMRQTGAGEDATMDVNSLEQERGITIYAKNASVPYQRTKINIVDTPGHADFGSEVERVLRSIDAVMLVVDAQEGPMPQTRFVLKKALELGLKPLVVINKVDKPAADPDWCEEEVLGLFFELGAHDEQADFPTIYAIGRDGLASRDTNGPFNDMTPLLDAILEYVPAAPAYEEGQSLSAQVFNLGYDPYAGRLAIARIYEGSIAQGQTVHIKDARTDGARTGNITQLKTFDGLGHVSVGTAYAGDIVLIAGLTDINIGETLTDSESAEPLPAISVDEPTISLQFMANASPFVGQEGTYVTSRQIRERLERELEVNVGLQVDFSSGDAFTVYGRGEMHISILMETMRREGYELAVSQPHVIFHEDEQGNTLEPFEELTIDIPDTYQGSVIEKLSNRGFQMQHMQPDGDQVRLIFAGPTRGLLGYRGQFTIDTKGEGIMSSQVVGYRPHAGDVQTRSVGSMVSMATGKTAGYSLSNLQERGVLYIGPATEVYEGQVIGYTSRGDDMVVNPTKGKQLTNVRSSGSDEALDLVPPLELTIERGLELMGDDELLEVTPESVRLRKEQLTQKK